MIPPTKIEQLIKALTLLHNNYAHLKPVTLSDPDTLLILMDAGPISLRHIHQLADLGFDVQQHLEDGFASTRHGSC